MRKYTRDEDNCIDILQLHLQMTYNNFTNEFDKIIENDSHYSSKAELLDLESYIFCLCFLSIRLKMIHQPFDKITAENLVNIYEEILQNYYDNYIEFNEYFKLDYIELFKHLEKRYNLYENKFTKGIDTFIKTFMIIIKQSLIKNKICNNFPFIEPKILTIGNPELYIKTVDNIEIIIKYFFNNGINDFYNNKDNKTCIDYFHSLEQNISKYIFLKGE